MKIKTIKIVCLSDTHGQHRKIKLPKGDILLHAGDYTRFGKEVDAVDFNDWLGTLDFKHKIIVNGNHENNMFRKVEPTSLISNGVVLRQEAIVVCGLKIFGTNFFWPCPTGNPYYDQIPDDCDVLMAHGPPKGIVDGCRLSYCLFLI